jgi:VanZ family protein
MPGSNSDLHYRGLWLLIGYLLLGLIVYLSVTSQPVELDLDFPYQDKVMHMFAYFALMAWFVQIYHIKKQRIYHAVAFILLGVVMEFIQSFDPARMAEFADMAANTAGVVSAALLSRYAGFRCLLQRAEAVLMKNEK